jgi:hypothetical protein
MSVHARALVPFGHVWQAVRGFDLEYAKDVHARIVPPAAGRRNQAPCSAAPPSRSWS